jgi:hypothetical protein
VGGHGLASAPGKRSLAGDGLRGAVAAHAGRRLNPHGNVVLDLLKSPQALARPMGGIPEAGAAWPRNPCLDLSYGVVSRAAVALACARKLTSGTVSK